MRKDACYNLSRETLSTILDNIYHEIYVTDSDMTILYVSERCRQHYGLRPEDMLGHNHMEFSGKYWHSSVLPLTYREKRRMCIEQMTVKGEKIVSTAVPVFDEHSKVKMVVSVVQEELRHLDMRVNPQSESEQALWVRRSPDASVPVSDIITRSPAMRSLLALSRKVAKSNISVLIEGESGTGKGMLASYLHEHSARSNYPFLSINCAAIPENLLESELFGYAPYAFTGASSKGKTGLIEMAEGGTLFLDEVAELAAPLQAKLLNVVDNNQYMQVGGKETKRSDVRIISATNQNLEQMVKDNTFREDLYWRLNIVELNIPSLIERKEDIIPLCSYYLNLYNTRYHQNKIISKEVFDIFMHYPWPGNVRQLRNLIERAFVLSEKPEFQPEDLPPILLHNATPQSPSPSCALDAQLESLEKAFIIALASKYKTSRQLASVLQTSQSTAIRLIQKHIG